jgi:hypothetical protein
MSDKRSASSDSDPERGYPVVVPPSGRFIAQLFLVPFFIVATVVGILLLVQWLVGRAHSPEDYLAKLDNPNRDVRWRGAEDLAQVLRRDDQLASDAHFALNLASRLQQALHEAEAESKGNAQRKPGVQDGAPAEPEEDELAGGRLFSLSGRGGYIFYLSACLGNVMVPVGAPLLGEAVLEAKGADPELVALRRRRALWVLAQLGDNVRRFARLPDLRQQAVLADLQAESEGSNPSRRAWAAAALAYFQGPEKGNLKVLGLDTVFTAAATDSDALLRSLAAFALNFWQGNASESARVDELLLKLTRDDGHGGQELQPRPDENGNISITRSPGSSIRFNAAIALARRGSTHVRLDLLKDMLDEHALSENFRIKLPDGREVADVEMVRTTLDGTLQALVELHHSRPDLDLSGLRSSLDTLAESTNLSLRGQAQQTIKMLGLQ